MTGRIIRLDTRGFGFVMGDDGIERFFAAREVRNFAFNSLTDGMRIQFESKKHPFKGLRAVRVYVLPAEDQVAA